MILAATDCAKLGGTCLTGGSGGGCDCLVPGLATVRATPSGNAVVVEYEINTSKLCPSTPIYQDTYSHGPLHWKDYKTASNFFNGGRVRVVFEGKVGNNCCNYYLIAYGCGLSPSDIDAGKGLVAKDDGTCKNPKEVVLNSLPQYVDCLNIAVWGNPGFGGCTGTLKVYSDCVGDVVVELRRADGVPLSHAPAPFPRGSVTLPATGVSGRVFVYLMMPYGNTLAVTAVDLPTTVTPVKSDAIEISFEVDGKPASGVVKVDRGLRVVRIILTSKLSQTVRGTLYINGVKAADLDVPAGGSASWSTSYNVADKVRIYAEFRWGDEKGLYYTSGAVELWPTDCPYKCVPKEQCNGIWEGYCPDGTVCCNTSAGSAKIVFVSADSQVSVKQGGDAVVHFTVRNDGSGTCFAQVTAGGGKWTSANPLSPGNSADGEVVIPMRDKAPGSYLVELCSSCVSLWGGGLIGQFLGQSLQFCHDRRQVTVLVTPDYPVVQITSINYGYAQGQLVVSLCYTSNKEFNGSIRLSYSGGMQQFQHKFETSDCVQVSAQVPPGKIRVSIMFGNIELAAKEIEVTNGTVSIVDLRATPNVCYNATDTTLTRVTAVLVGQQWRGAIRVLVDGKEVAKKDSVYVDGLSPVDFTLSIPCTGATVRVEADSAYREIKVTPTVVNKPSYPICDNCVPADQCADCGEFDCYGKKGYCCCRRLKQQYPTCSNCVPASQCTGVCTAYNCNGMQGYCCCEQPKRQCDLTINAWIEGGQIYATANSSCGGIYYLVTTPDQKTYRVDKWPIQPVQSGAYVIQAYDACGCYASTSVYYYQAPTTPPPPPTAPTTPTTPQTFVQPPTAPQGEMSFDEMMQMMFMLMMMAIAVSIVK